MIDYDPRELLEALERGAVAPGAEASRDMGEESLDLIRIARGDEDAPAHAPDATLGGYMAHHDRPAAFEGCDGQPYTVGVDVEETEAANGPFAAFFVFVRWAETGAGIMAHVESEDVAWGASDEEARQAALDLSLYEVKSALDAAIRRKTAELEDR